MNTPSTCRAALRPYDRRPPWRAETGSCVARRSRRGPWAVCAMLGSVALTGCTYSGGEMLFFLGVGQGKLVKAQFLLADGPILILLDDPSERIDWPAAKRYVFNELSQALVRVEAAKKIIPLQTLERLQRNEPDFAQRGCREVGRLAGAEQVLWLEVQDYLADKEFYDPANAAYCVVTVKVIDTQEEKRSRVRLWPTSSEGRLVTARLSGSEVIKAKTKDAVARALATQLAEGVAKLFYDYRLGDFEREP